MNPIYSAVNHSVNIVKSLVADPHIKKNENLSKIMQKALGELESCQEGEKAEKNKAIWILQHIDQQVGSTDTLNQHKSAAIHAKLNKALNLLTAAEAKEISPAKPNVSKIDMNLAFLCDIDAPDHNGAIESTLFDIFRSQVPFVTTRSLLCSTKNESRKNLRLEQILLTQADLWSIYQQKACNGEGFLVFIPQATGNEEESRELLVSYDFNPDHLEKISALQALVPPKENTSFDSFAELFTDNPQKNKLFYLDGHGGARNPGGLTGPHYEKLLQLLARQKCQGFIVSSCYSGGESTLLHIEKAKATNEEKVQADYRDIPMTNLELKFPVIMRSIGDFVTSSGQQSLSSFFYKLALFFESGEGETVKNLRAVLKQSEGRFGRVKGNHNLNQVYYPSGADSPAGFRPVGEKEESFSLTFNRLQSEKILGNPQIRVENKKLLEIHPMVVDKPLVFEANDPILLSMIPGQAHHYLSEVQLEELSHKEFFDKINAFYKEGMLEVSKGFYIKKLRSNSGEYYEDVAFCFGLTNYFLFRMEDQHYIWNATSKEAKKISKIQFDLALNNWTKETKPADSAVLSQSGGMQDNTLFDQVLKMDTFSEEEITDINDQESLVFHYLSSERADLALALIKKNGLSTNMTNLLDRPLLVQTAIESANDLALYLLENKAEPNCKNPTTGNTPLHIAVISQNNPLVTALLSKGADLEVRNEQGATPIFCTLPNNIELFRQLKAAGANINALKNNTSLLAQALRYEDCSLLPTLLAEGIDPNLGTPSPLQIAMLNNDGKSIDMLLENGASLGKHILEAMERCSPDIVLKLLKNLDPAIKNACLLRSLGLANLNYVEALLAEGAEIPYYFDEDLKRGLNRMDSAKDFRIIEALLKKSSNEKFKQNVFEYLTLPNNFNHLKPILEALINHSIINLNEKADSYGPSYFQKIISLGDLDLVKLAVSKVEKIQADESGKSPLSYAINHPIVFKWLMEQGCDINQETLFIDNYPLFKIVKSGNIELAKYCLDHGARLNLMGMDLTDYRARKQITLQEAVLKVATESGNAEMVKLIQSKII